MPPWQLMTDLEGTHESPLTFAGLVHNTGSKVYILLATPRKKFNAIVSFIYSYVAVLTEDIVAAA